MKKKLKRLKEALSLARGHSGYANARVAAIIEKRNTVIAYGLNSGKSHPLQAKFKDNPHRIFLHAEMDAIKNAVRQCNKESLEGATIYVARVLKDGIPALAKPCNGCMTALRFFGIKNVYWSTGDERFYGS